MFLFFSLVGYLFFNISQILINFRFWFHNLFNNFFSSKFKCCFSCFMDCFYWSDILQHLVLFLWQYPILFSHFCWIDFLKMTKIHILRRIFLFLVTCYLYLLISSVKLTLFSISNGLTFNIFIHKCYDDFIKLSEIKLIKLNFLD